MTRRVVTKRNTLIDGYPWSRHEVRFEDLDFSPATADDGPSPAGNPGPYLHVPHRNGETWHRIYPIYAPGDLLWLREKHLVWQSGDGFKNYCDEDSPIYQDNPEWEHYLFDNGELDDIPACNDGVIGRWRIVPSIHMPRYGSRLTLRISRIRVERLQEITELDATHEGIEKRLGIHVRADFAKPWDSLNAKRDYSWESNAWRWVIEWHARPDFAKLWDSLNAKRGYSWESNPWVWVIEWDRVWMKNVDLVIEEAAT